MKVRDERKMMVEQHKGGDGDGDGERQGGAEDGKKKSLKSSMSEV